MRRAVLPVGAGRHLAHRRRALQNADYLLGINPATGSATPLRPLANLSSQRLTTDLGTAPSTAQQRAISRLIFPTGP
jgi:hypothetical protein